MTSLGGESVLRWATILDLLIIVNFNPMHGYLLMEQLKKLFWNEASQSSTHELISTMFDCLHKQSPRRTSSSINMSV
jgi:hypothetical protein